jgi:dTDP-4-amino-4,6-dideoxygalactose transaminase
VAESYYEGALSLPMFYSLTDAEQDRVVQAVREVLGHG